MTPARPRGWLLCAGACLCVVAHAQAPVPNPRGGYPAVPQVVVGPAEGMARARRDAQPGPAAIVLERATLRLPKAMSFVPREASRYYLAMHGMGPTLETIGMVFPDGDWRGWHAVLEYHPVGFVRDNDASLDPEGVLARLREIQQRTNPQLRRAGLPERQVLGWIEPPAYLRERRTLVWAIAFRSLGPNPAEEITYRFFNLGRAGYFSWRVVMRPAASTRELDEVRELWRAIDFGSGQRHADHQGSDPVAPVSVRGLLPDR